VATSLERFTAMGVTASLTVHVSVGGDSVAEQLSRLGRERIEILEQSWSRFRDTSELSQLNRLAGDGPVAVSEDMWLLVSAMMDGWRITNGRYDPTVYHAMMTLGYDATLTSVPWNHGTFENAAATPGMAAIRLDEAARTVTLPAGVGLDSGGIGKGLAGDIVSWELMSAGADGVAVDLGGDVVFRGTPPHTGGWHITVTPRHHPPLALSATGVDGHVGVATSGLRTRQWGDTLFHIVEPTVGLPAISEVDEVTVLAAAGWLAEIHSKGALLASGQADDYLHQHHLDGAIFWRDGTTSVTDALRGAPV
jgi:thiamine biosynthesis lipoprotein